MIHDTFYITVAVDVSYPEDKVEDALADVVYGFKYDFSDMENPDIVIEDYDIIESE